MLPGWTIPGIFLAAVLAMGCNDEKSKHPTPVPQGANAKQSKGTGTDTVAQQGLGSSTHLERLPPDKLPTGSLLKAKMSVNVRSVLLPLCKGTLDLNINAAMGKVATTKFLDIPNGTVKCPVVGDMDLAALMAPMLKPAPPDNMVIDANVIAMKSIGDNNFNPPHVFMPAFLSAKHEDLAALEKSETETVTGPYGTSTGTSTIKVLEILDSYDDAKTGKTFKNVIHFRVSNKGYDGKAIDKMSGMLIDVVEMKIALNPVSVLSIHFEGEAVDLIVAGRNAKVGGKAGKSLSFEAKMEKWAIIGPITKKITSKLRILIDIDLLSQEGLDTAQGNGDDGEVIGK